MKSQKDIWEDEHASAAEMPSLARPEPSDSVVRFVEWLRNNELPIHEAQALDIGAGKGRNAVYLAEQGMHVFAIDYIESAIDELVSFARSRGVGDDIVEDIASLTDPWPYQNEIFDYAIDCYTSIDIETPEGRAVYVQELERVLKPGGIAMVAVVSTEDEIEQELLQTSPGPEDNSTIWPDSGKFQKDYSEEELRAFYSSFNILHLELFTKQAHKLNRDFTARNWWLLIQKPE